MNLVNKALATSAISLFIGAPAYAWVPCAPICDLQCMGLTMSLQTAEHVVKIANLKLTKLYPTQLDLDALPSQYESFGDDISSAWDDGRDKIKSELIESTLFQQSYTDRITSALSGTSSVVEASFKGASRVDQDINLELQNLLTRVAEKSLQTFSVGLEHSQHSNIDPVVTLLPYSLEHKRSNMNKRVIVDYLQRDTVKDYIFGNMHRKALLSVSSNGARRKMIDTVLGTTQDFSVESDPYMAKIPSIPFRISTIRRNKIAFEATKGVYISETMIGANKAGLYSTLLTQRNLANMLLLDTIDRNFIRNLPED